MQVSFLVVSVLVAAVCICDGFLLFFGGLVSSESCNTWLVSNAWGVHTTTPLPTLQAEMCKWTWWKDKGRKGLASRRVRQLPADHTASSAWRLSTKFGVVAIAHNFARRRRVTRSLRLNWRSKPSPDSQKCCYMLLPDHDVLLRFLRMSNDQIPRMSCVLDGL